MAVAAGTGVSMCCLSPNASELRKERYHYAQKAGEAFIAAGRATSEAESLAHRACALRYASLLIELPRDPD